jgi:hypothetical protein
VSLRYLDGLLVGGALGVVLGLRGLVAESVLGGAGTGADAGVAVLGDLLVGLLGGGSGGLLDLLANKVTGLLDGLHCG